MSGVIFDLDGVLIDSEGLQHKAYSRILERYGVSVTQDEYARHWIAQGRGPEYAVEKYGIPLEPDEIRAQKHPIYREILRAEVTLMPGVLAALERLSPRFPIALATNSKADEVAFVMDHFGLRPHFAALISRERYERAKPEPDAFLAAAQALEREPGQCLVVEDSRRGVLAATRAGTPVAAVPNEWTRQSDFSSATRVLAGLDELTVALVEELTGN